MAIPVTIDPPPASEQPNGGAAAADSKSPTSTEETKEGKRKAKATNIAAAGLTSPRPPSSIPPPATNAPKSTFASSAQAFPGPVADDDEGIPQQNQAPRLQTLAGDDGWDADFGSEPVGGHTSHQSAAPVAAAAMPATTQPAFDPFSNFNDVTPVVTSSPPAAATATRPVPSFDAFPSFEAPSAAPATSSRLSVGFPPTAGGSGAFDPFASSAASSNGGDAFASFGDDPFAPAATTGPKAAAPMPTGFPAQPLSLATGGRVASNPFDVLPPDASAVCNPRRLCLADCALFTKNDVMDRLCQ
jgi:hypothetical protein